MDFDTETIVMLNLLYKLRAATYDYEVSEVFILKRSHVVQTVTCDGTVCFLCELIIRQVGSFRK